MGFPDRAVGKESTCNAGVSNYWVLSHARLFVTPWTAAHQAPLSMKFSRQGYGSGLPFPSPGDLPNPGIEPGSPELQANSLPTELQGNSSWALSNPKRWCCPSAVLNMPANLENLAVATGLEKVSFHSNPKERQCQRTLKLLHSSHTQVK